MPIFKGFMPPFKGFMPMLKGLCRTIQGLQANRYVQADMFQERAYKVKQTQTNHVDFALYA